MILCLVVVTVSSLARVHADTPITRASRKERKARAAHVKRWQKVIDDAEDHLTASIPFTTPAGHTISPEQLHPWILFIVHENPGVHHHRDVCPECLDTFFQESVSEKTPAPVPEKTPDENPEKRSTKNAGADPEKMSGILFGKTADEKRPTKNAENPAHLSWENLRDQIWSSIEGKWVDDVPEKPARFVRGGSVPTFTSNYVFQNWATDEPIRTIKTPEPETVSCPLCTATSQDLPAHMRDYHPSAMGWVPQEMAAGREAETDRDPAVSVWDQIINGPSTDTSGRYCLLTTAHRPHGYCAGKARTTTTDQRITPVYRCGAHDVHGPHRHQTWQGDTVWCEGFTGATPIAHQYCPSSSWPHTPHQWHDFEATTFQVTRWCDGDKTP
jgi:hypothetical protein